MEEHGNSVLLKGLKKITKNITTIVAMGDNGGGTGKLREDLRNASTWRYKGMYACAFKYRTRNGKTFESQISKRRIKWTKFPETYF